MTRTSKAILAMIRVAAEAERGGYRLIDLPGLFALTGPGVRERSSWALAGAERGAGQLRPGRGLGKASKPGWGVDEQGSIELVVYRILRARAFVVWNAETRA